MAELKTTQEQLINTCITKERVGRLVYMLPERNERTPWNDAGDGNLFADWCLEGLWMLLETGLEPPDSVRQATDAYRRDSDKVGRFLEDVLEPDPQGEALLTDVYSLYTGWCMRSGLRPESLTGFRRELGGRAELKNKRPAGSGRKGTMRSMILGYRTPEYPAVSIHDGM